MTAIPLRLGADCGPFQTLTRFRSRKGHATLGVFAAILLGFCTPVQGAEKDLVTAGEFTRIYDPSVGEDQTWYINDHTFVCGPDGVWHLFGITHPDPANPAEERVFAHATADALLRVPWVKRPFALTYAPAPPWNETHLWAPYVIRNKGTYYMFYCAGDSDHARYKIHLATSTDLVTWRRHPGNPVVVDGYDARDPFVMRLGQKWLLYYTANSKPTGGNHVVACVTSTDLVTWGDRRVVYTDPEIGTFGGPTESPFVVQRGKSFYLFMGPRPSYDGTDVFVSHDPFSWKIQDKVGHIQAHAAEVVRDKDGKWYVSRAGWGERGVFLAPLYWHDGEDDGTTNMLIPDGGIPMASR